MDRRTHLVVASFERENHGGNQGGQESDAGGHGHVLRLVDQAALGARRCGPLLFSAGSLGRCLAPASLATFTVGRW